jgi:hypothetical protein
VKRALEEARAVLDAGADHVEVIRRIEDREGVRIR